MSNDSSIPADSGSAGFTGSAADSPLAFGPPKNPAAPLGRRAKPTANKNASPSAPRVDGAQPPPSQDDQSKLIDQTKIQIRELVQEISDLARSECSVEEFYEGFLTRIVSALASVGGAIWIRESVGQPIDLQFHINLKQTALHDDLDAQRLHGQLIRRLLDAGEPALVAPDSAASDDSVGGNPTDNLLVVGLVEIFQRPGAGPTTQRGYMRFLLQMCEIGSEFLGNQRLRSFQQQQQVWHKLEKFIQAVHQNLDVDQTVYAIANEGRRLIECDRVSIAIAQGRHCYVKAVSGLDSIERRSEQVKKLGYLASAVTRTGTPLWYQGEDDDLPPQIEKRLHDYVDKSHAKMLAVIPLMKSEPESDSDVPQKKKKQTPIGAMIVEQLKDSRVASSLENRVKLVSQHAQTALTNSIDHNSIFLMPLWKAIGKVFNQFQGQKLLRTASILTAFGLTGAFLWMFPYQFSMGARGSLIPETQHEVYAQVDGILAEVLVSDTGDTIVEQDQLLARMTSSATQLAMQDLKGRIKQAEQEFLLCQRLEPGLPQGPEAQSNQLRKSQAWQNAESLKAEYALRARDAELLNIKSPQRGRVINWQVRQNLIRRPVRFGQHLMTIVDPETQWLIELEMPERRVAHLMKAMQEADEPLTVTFGLVSHPGEEFTGTLKSVDQKLEVHSDDGNAALVRVAFPNDSVPQELLRSGTRVTAQVQCGTTSFGYAMFHELIETVQAKWKLWF